MSGGLTLYLTDSYKCLRDLRIKLAVTSGTLLRFRRLLLEKSRSAKEGGFLMKKGDRYVFLDTREEEVARELARMERFVDEMQEITEVYDAVPLLRLPRDRTYAISELFGQPCAGSIALAHARGYVLWTDDGLAAAFASKDYGVRRVWTEAVFQRAFEKGLVPIQRRDDLVIRLVVLGYWYTRLSPETVLTAARRYDWDADVAELKAVLSWFGNPHTKAEGIYGIASRVLLEIARGHARPFLCEAVAFRLLDHIDQRPDGRRIIRAMYDQAGQIFHMELQRSIVPAFRNLIKGWRASRGA